MKRMVEICCGSYEDAISSFKAGAKRIELNSALYLGGLTPSLASLILTKKNTDLKVIVMIRPRGAGFCYSKEEFEVMKLDTRLMLENGADGIAFGCLNQDREINIEQTKEIVEIVKEFGKEVVFHRAFDCVKDVDKAIKTLIDLKIDRVLTSGLNPKAIDATQIISYLQSKYGDKIEILAGSGLNHTNALEIIEKTKINQIHSSCKTWKEDSTTSGEIVNFCYANHPHENEYDVVDEELVKKIVKSIN